MHHHASVSAVEIEWTFASVRHPCIICAGQDGCRKSYDGEFACCTRIASEWPLSAGGWVHRVSRAARAAFHALGEPSAAAREDLATSLAQ